jgi:hypothetical protein
MNNLLKHFTNNNLKSILNTQYFSQNCVIKMYDPKFKYLKLAHTLKKGDVIEGPNKNPVKISCVIKKEVPYIKDFYYNYTANFVSIGKGGLLAPYHPIKLNNKWVSPVTLGALYRYDADYVYNFVLDTDHVLIVNNIECATIGNNQNSYSSEIITNLSQLDGWNTGLITLNNNKQEQEQYKEQCNDEMSIMPNQLSFK